PVTILAFFTAWAIFKLIFKLVLYPQFFTPLEHIPTPNNRNWLTGNSNSYSIEVPYAMIERWIKSMPDASMIRYYIVGNSEWVLPTSPEAIYEMLVKRAYDFEKPELVRHVMQHLVGDGIVQRKSLNLAFSPRHIENLHAMFWSKSLDMVSLIEKDFATRTNGDNTIKISDWSSRVTLDIIGQAGMGVEFDSLENPQSTLYQAYRKLMTPSKSEKLLSVFCILFLQPKLIYRIPTRRNREIKASQQTIRDAARRVIQQRMAEKETVETKIDIVSLALSSKAFTEEGLVDQAMAFLSAGHETTAAALQWSVYALCKYPDVQMRLREEVRAHLPVSSMEEPNLPLTAIKNLPFLNAFCDEVLRYYPPVPKTVRRAVRDTLIAGHFIPKGTMFVLAPQVINHMEELWGPNAKAFDPNRFISPTGAYQRPKSNNYAFLTFLHGPRSCIAQDFAKAELCFLISSLVRRFHMELQYPNAKLLVQEDVTVRPSDGVLAKFTTLEGL
ncbi:hypothetical protein PENARI_c153G08078, partial [Penicillium arizonense]